MTPQPGTAALPGPAAPDVADDSAIDWALAEKIAVRTSGDTGFARSRTAVTMPAELRSLTELSQGLVEDFTNLRSRAGVAHAEVIDRPDWIRANLRGFRHMLEPIAAKLADADAERSGGAVPTWTRQVGRRVLGVELGVVLGFLSQRVLGQYDLLLPDDVEGAPGVPGGVVYYVGPNIAQLEQRHGFIARDFRLWIALHEVTHRTQFTAVDWMRPYFLSLVDDTLGSIDPDPARVVRALRSVVDRVRSGRNPVPDEGLMALFATPEQRSAMDRSQALMTLLEGHGNFVMDTLGERHVAGQRRMAATLSQRRRKGGLSRIVLRAMGMEMKARQYEEGQRFLDALAALHGDRAIDLAWRTRDALPTLEELRGGPDAWWRRMQSHRPAA
jgi:coenzyme F420 biosynthesis associated uncharacterized protein